MAGSHAARAGDRRGRSFIVGALLTPAAAQSCYRPLGKQRPARCSWRCRSSQLLPSSHRCYQGVAVNQVISNAAPVRARRCGGTCRNAAGAAPSCSRTRHPSHRRCFKGTVQLNRGGGIVALNRKQKHGSAQWADPFAQLTAEKHWGICGL